MKKLTPIKAIRAYCMECGERSYEEVKLCPIATCPLFAYRFGKRPQVGKEGIIAKTPSL